MDEWMDPPNKIQMYSLLMETTIDIITNDSSLLSITVTFDMQLPDIQIAKREANKQGRVPNNPLQTLDLLLLSF